MALKGDLNDFDLREIMHFIGDRMKDGRLALSGAGRSAAVEFGKGKITRVILHQKPPLLSRLEDAGYVPAGTAAKLADGASDDVGQRQLVLSKKLAGKDDLNRFLVREIAKDLAELLFWEEAEFEFANTEEPPPPLVELKVDDAVREAISMSVELRNLKKRFPDGASLRLDSSPLPEPVTIDPEAWGIVAQFTKEIKVDDLAKASALDSFTFYGMLARVADRGLLTVEAAQPAAAEKPEPAKSPAKSEPAEAEAKADKVEKKAEAAPPVEPLEKKPEPAPINGKYVAVA